MGCGNHQAKEAERLYNEGVKALYGVGLPMEDFDAAKKLFMEASKVGSTKATCRLAHFDGQAPLDKTTVEAVQKLADGGDADAMNVLGGMLRRAIGVARDEAKAIDMWRKAAAAGSLEGKYLFGDQITNGCSRDEGEDGAAEGYAMLLEAADAGFFSARERFFYYVLRLRNEVKLEGKAIPDNPEASIRLAIWKPRAVRYAREAAQAGSVTGMGEWGRYLIEGFGVAQNEAEGSQWVRRAAELDKRGYAQEKLSALYFSGIGVPQDDKAGMHWLRRAALCGNPSAMRELGSRYESGSACPQNFIEAYAWLNIAAGERDFLGEAAEHKASLTPKLTRQQQNLGQERSAQLQAIIKKGGNDANALLPPPTPVLAESAPATLTNTPPNRDENGLQGTGFAVASNHILTALHVIKGASRIQVRQGDKSFDAKLVTSDPEHDLAVLEVNTDFPPLPVAGSSAVQVGDRVATVGFPNASVMGVTPKLTTGEVNSLAGIQDDPTLFQVSLPVQPGNSGGPLLDERGNVVGVVTAVLSWRASLASSGALPQNVNYAVKSTHVIRLLAQVKGYKAPELAREKLPLSALSDRLASSVVMVVTR